MLGTWPQPLLHLTSSTHTFSTYETSQADVAALNIMLPLELHLVVAGSRDVVSVLCGGGVKVQEMTSPVFALDSASCSAVGGCWSVKPMHIALRTCDVPGHIRDAQAHHCPAHAEWPTVQMCATWCVVCSAPPRESIQQHCTYMTFISRATNLVKGMVVIGWGGHAFRATLGAAAVAEAPVLVGADDMAACVIGRCQQRCPTGCSTV